MKFFSKPKSQVQKLQEQYEKLRKDAMLAQRGGDIVKSAELHAKADELLKEIESGAGAST